MFVEALARMISATTFVIIIVVAILALSGLLPAPPHWYLWLMLGIGWLAFGLWTFTAR